MLQFYVHGATFPYMKLAECADKNTEHVRDR